MENYMEVRADTGLQWTRWLTTGAAAKGPEGYSFTTALASYSGTSPFKDKLGDFSQDLFNGMVNEFGNEAKNDHQGR